MVYLLALLSAAFYGAADFTGGFASRRAPMFSVVTISQLAGLLSLLPVLPRGARRAVWLAVLASAFCIARSRSGRWA